MVPEPSKMRLSGDPLTTSQARPYRDLCSFSCHDMPRVAVENSQDRTIRWTRMEKKMLKAVLFLSSVRRIFRFRVWKMASIAREERKARERRWCSPELFAWWLYSPSFKSDWQVNPIFSYFSLTQSTRTIPRGKIDPFPGFPTGSAGLISHTAISI